MSARESGAALRDLGFLDPHERKRSGERMIWEEGPRRNRFPFMRFLARAVMGLIYDGGGPREAPGVPVFAPA